MSLYVLGASSDIDSYFCHHLAKRIAKIAPDIKVEFELCLEIEYVRRLNKLKETLGGELYTHSKTHVVLRNGTEYIGDALAMISLAKNGFGIEDAEIANNIVFNRMRKEETSKLLQETGRPFVFLEFNEDPNSVMKSPVQYGKVVIELFADMCPLACENFIKLCSGELGVENNVLLHYAGSGIHRLVPGGWMQCGDIVTGTGADSVAAIGTDRKVQDECFSVDFGCPEGGIVGYSSSSPHGIGSQFFITFGPCEWMQNSFVGFGRVVVGNNVLKAIERIPTTNQKPTKTVIITSCGEGMGNFDESS